MTQTQNKQAGEQKLVCPNCGQWQHSALGGYDCINECVGRGLAPRPKTGERTSRYVTTKDLYETAKARDAYKLQRDELLAALVEVTNSLAYVCEQEDKFRSVQLNGRAVRDQRIAKARAVIAKVEGSK